MNQKSYLVIISIIILSSFPALAQTAVGYNLMEKLYHQNIENNSSSSPKMPKIFVLDRLTKNHVEPKEWIDMYNLDSLDVAKTLGTLSKTLTPSNSVTNFNELLNLSKRERESLRYIVLYYNLPEFGIPQITQHFPTFKEDSDLILKAFGSKTDTAVFTIF